MDDRELDQRLAKLQMWIESCHETLEKIIEQLLEEELTKEEDDKEEQEEEHETTIKERKR